MKRRSLKKAPFDFKTVYKAADVVPVRIPGLRHQKPKAPPNGAAVIYVN
jgi:hypothetical protein